MTRRRGLAGVVPEAICVAAVAAMAWATSLPFMGVPAWWGDGLEPGGNLVVTTWSLAGGNDARIVIVTLVVLGAAVAAHLMGIHRRLTAFICLIASSGSLLLALFEIGDGGRRVLPSWTFPTPGISPAPVSIAAGFYVFRDAAAIALIASLIMFVMSTWDKVPTSHHSLHPRLS
jgi:hypothetical protein